MTCTGPGIRAAGLPLTPDILGLEMAALGRGKYPLEFNFSFSMVNMAVRDFATLDLVGVSFCGSDNTLHYMT
jgi:hypothetical protein